MGLCMTAGHLGKVASTTWCDEEVTLKYLAGSCQAASHANTTLHNMRLGKLNYALH